MITYNIPEEEVYRLSYFSLIGNILLEKHAKIKNIINQYFDYYWCLECLDGIFYRSTNFMKINSSNNSRVLENIKRELINQSEICFDHNEEVGDIFREIAGDVDNKYQKWDLEDELNNLHVQGRNLAIELYKKCPGSILASRLQKKCKFSIELHRDKQAPAVFKKPDELVLRYGPSHTFKHFLIYPFLIYHEYTSHIFPFDNNRNDIFHDGWLLAVAEIFLRKKLGEDYSAKRTSKWIFDQTNMHSKLYPYPDKNSVRIGHQLAEIIGINIEHLYRITCELSCYQPQAREDPLWPTALIHQLW
jgi:hypothetical protein